MISIPLWLFWWPVSAATHSWEKTLHLKRKTHFTTVKSKDYKFAQFVKDGWWETLHIEMMSPGYSASKHQTSQITVSITNLSLQSYKMCPFEYHKFAHLIHLFQFGRQMENYLFSMLDLSLKKKWKLSFCKLNTFFTFYHMSEPKTAISTVCSNSIKCVNFFFFICILLWRFWDIYQNYNKQWFTVSPGWWFSSKLSTSIL